MNRRRLLNLIASLALAGPLAAAPAEAQDRGDRRGGRGSQRGRDGGGRGNWQSRGGGDGGGRGYLERGEYRERGDDRWSGDRGGGRWVNDRSNGQQEERRMPQRDYDAPPRTSRAPYPEDYRPRAPDVQRGGSMPRDYRGEALGDPGRYRLRPAPRGYSWYRVGNGYALVDERSGQIFDMIPD